MVKSLIIYKRKFLELKDYINNSDKYGIKPSILLVVDLKKRLQYDQNILKRRMSEKDYNSSAYLFTDCNDNFKEIELFLKSPNESRFIETDVIKLVRDCKNLVDEIYGMLLTSEPVL